MQSFEVIYRDDRRDRAELNFDIMCRMSERFNIQIADFGNLRLDWLAWGIHIALSEAGLVTTTLEVWRKAVTEFVPVESDDLNPTLPAA